MSKREGPVEIEASQAGITKSLEAITPLFRLAEQTFEDISTEDWKGWGARIMDDKHTQYIDPQLGLIILETKLPGEKTHLTKTVSITDDCHISIEQTIPTKDPAYISYVITKSPNMLLIRERLTIKLSAEKNIQEFLQNPNLLESLQKGEYIKVSSGLGINKPKPEIKIDEDGKVNLWLPNTDNPWQAAYQRINEISHIEFTRV